MKANRNYSDMTTNLQKQTKELKTIAERMQRENIRMQNLKEKLLIYMKEQGLDTSKYECTGK